MKKIKENTIILIPIYNEEKGIRRLAPFINTIDNNKYVFINDGSSDNSLNQLKISKFRYIDLKNNTGKGNAITVGINYAKEKGDEWVITFDGDLQHPPALVSNFDNGNKVEIKLGWRKNKKSMPLFRKLSNNISSLLLSIRANSLIKDSQCGYRGFPVDTYLKCNNKEPGFHMESEFLMKACLLGIPIKHVEIPTIYNDSESSMNYFPDLMKFIALWFRSFFW